ncbi:hypothetical protein F2P56_005041 [Juglans regia]|uniref:Uncharacterized protein LOC109010641 n=2 Tax=Juglans regia TaxID=51240 RepID=A0A2I4GT59_JUGRE|nr:uncharacterized protein LOC109010641 [Juglans regia]KAF5478484.1 hypothetical protein F2P56_005041 [Juglans regia]
MPMLRERSLLYAENLTPPSVIVMTANMGCDRCRQRVSQVASKMTGLEECTVDVQNRRVTMKAEFGFQWKAKPGAPKSKMNKELRPLTYLLKPFRGTCFGNHLAN